MSGPTDFKKVCNVSDIEEGEYNSFVVEGRAILLCKWQGNFYAIEDECSHAMNPLCGGRMRRGTIVCPLHGARFNIKTGAAEGAPATLPIDTFEVRTDGQSVSVAVTQKRARGGMIVPPGTLPTSSSA